MTNILYVHGYGSNKNTITAKAIEKELLLHSVNVKVYTFDVNEDPTLAIKQIQHLLRTKNIDISIGSSYGCFPLLFFTNILKIFINPCLNPSVELPKLSGVGIDVIEKCKMLEQKLNNCSDNEAKAFTYGIFATNDELFSYKSTFTHLFGGANVSLMSGGHRINASNIKHVLIPVIEHIIEKHINVKINESALNEHFVTLMDKKEMLKYGNQVYNILQRTYAPIGGLLGCNSVDELISDTDFWKLVRRGDKITACMIYSSKRGGRKIVFGGQDGTLQGKQDFYSICKEDIKITGRNAWAEVSGAM